MSRVYRGFLFFAVALAALAAGYYYRTSGDVDATTQDSAQVLLAARLADLDGKVQPLAQWRGKVMVVNFWATWCPPCLKEIPEFIRMQSRYGARGVQFVGLAIDDHTRVAAFAARHGINYPVLMAKDEGLTLARNAGNRLEALPFTVIIDKHGRTARVELGVLDESKLAPMLDALL
jgi:thiol-disulfide isomerase/thioredoxin